MAKTHIILASIPNIVERFLLDDPTLAEPRSLLHRNAFQARMIENICAVHRITSPLAQTEIGLAVADAYRAHVPLA